MYVYISICIFLDFYTYMDVNVHIYYANIYVHIYICKVWFPDTAEAVNGYELYLHPPTSKKDIAYWINAEIKRNLLEDNLTGTLPENIIYVYTYYLYT
jgi:hypothetical protein